MSKFDSHKWQKEFQRALLEKDEKKHLKDLLHTNKVDGKKADKVDIKIGAENDLAIEKDKDGNDVYARGLTEAITKPYQLGDKWSNDFDYVGMLKMGAQTTYELYEANGLEALQDLFASFEDVNYHTEARDLSFAIEEIEQPGENPDRTREVVENELENFRRACLKTLQDMNIKWTPQR